MQQLIFGVARHEFVVKPLGALYSLHATVPQVHHDFWAQFLVQDLLDLHMAHLIGLTAETSWPLGKNIFRPLIPPSVLRSGLLSL